MKRATVYIETSLISYLVANPSRDIVIAAHQQITHEWWDRECEKYDLFISQIVLDEASRGDAAFADKRLTVLGELSLLDISEKVVEFAETLITKHAVPSKAALDALHISITAVHHIDYLLTWNCKHIANATMRSTIERICRECGYPPPIICTRKNWGNIRMWNDPIVEEIRRVREEIAAQFNYDVKALGKYYQERQNAERRTIVARSVSQPTPNSQQQVNALVGDLASPNK